MKWSEYKTEAERTFAYMSGNLGWLQMQDKLDQMHCAIGISTEIAEFMGAIAAKDFVNANEELGDIFWYVANLERLIKHESEHLPNPTGLQKLFVDEWLVGHQELLDHYKKAVYYGSDVDKIYVQKHVDITKDILINIIYNAGENVQDILSKNIKKLKIRYPDKFTQDSAENRDLDEERNVLE